MEPFNKKFGASKEREKLIRRIVDSRNYLTHYNETLTKKLAQGTELWEICQKMEAILQLHFLERIGFSLLQIDDLIEKSESLKQKLTQPQ